MAKIKNMFYTFIFNSTIYYTPLCSIQINEISIKIYQYIYNILLNLINNNLLYPSIEICYMHMPYHDSMH